MLSGKEGLDVPMKRHGAHEWQRRSLAGYLTVLVVCGWAALGAARSGAEDLQTAYRQAAAASPVIAQAQAQLDAEFAGRPLARAAVMPHINAAASGGMNTAYVTGFGAAPLSTGYHSDVFSASLTETIFDGQAFTAMKQADHRIQASEAALAFAQQLIALEVTQAYFGVLQAQANERVAQQQMALLQSMDDQTNANLKVGTGDIISVQEVQAQLDAAKADVIATRNAVEVAKSQLERLTHHPVEALQDVTTLEAVGPQPDAMEPWVDSAMRNQPLLRQAQETLHVSERQVQFAKRARWPTLSLNGIGMHAAGTLIPPVTVDQIGASFNVAIPIYEGGGTRASIHQAEAQARASKANVANVQDQIRLDTETAFLDLQNSVAQFAASRQAVTSAQVAMAGTRKGYEIGSRSIIDLLTATTNYAAAERTYYLALYMQLVARTQLKAAAGVLTPTDIDAINVLLDSNPSK